MRPELFFLFFVGSSIAKRRSEVAKCDELIRLFVPEREAEASEALKEGEPADVAKLGMIRKGLL